MSLAPGDLDQALRCDYPSCGYWERVERYASVDYDDPAWILMHKGWMIERVNGTVASICPQHAKQDDARYYAFKRAADFARSGFERELFRTRLAHETYALQARQLQQNAFPSRDIEPGIHRSESQQVWESFERAYARTRPTPATSAPERMVQQYTDHRLLSELMDRPAASPEGLTYTSPRASRRYDIEDPRYRDPHSYDPSYTPPPVRYAQGMARGYYRGGVKGLHPGYRKAPSDDDEITPISRRMRRKLKQQGLPPCSSPLSSSSASSPSS